MGISVALTATTVTVSKSMITNASFRTKKLPGEYELYVFRCYSFRNSHAYQFERQSCVLSEVGKVMQLLVGKNTFDFRKTSLILNEFSKLLLIVIATDVLCLS